MATRLLVLSLTLILSAIHQISGFLVSSGHPSLGQLSYRSCFVGSRPIPSKLKAKDLVDSGDNVSDDDDEDEEPELITKEKFYRELMGISDGPGNKKKAKGKNKKAIKRPHDNRDQLPFLVQVMTPPEEPYEQQALVRQKKSKQKKKKGASSDANSMDTEIVGQTLGEFPFEKNTSSGDKIEIDNTVYVVQRAKCQYKYAGGQKFVMVRKILQVKPIQRAMQEDYIMRQWNAPPAEESE